MWSLEKSEAVQAVLKEKYKQQRHSDDENQPLSVQPWGFDGDKRRYFLIQGLDDTGFRVYREGFRHTKNAYWWSVAGSIEEAKELASKLYDVDGSQAARRLAAKIYNAVPMFEATEEVRLIRTQDANMRLRLTCLYRNDDVANTAKYVALLSHARNQASRCTREGHGGGVLATHTTTKTPMPPTTSTCADLPGTLLVVLLLMRGQQSLPVVAK